jgi:hypothetical protein
MIFGLCPWWGRRCNEWTLLEQKEIRKSCTYDGEEGHTQTTMLYPGNHYWLRGIWYFLKVANLWLSRSGATNHCRRLADWIPFCQIRWYACSKIRDSWSCHQIKDMLCL